MSLAPPLLKTEAILTNQNGKNVKNYRKKMIKKLHAASSEGLRKYTIVKKEKENIKTRNKSCHRHKSSAPILNKASLFSLQTIILITYARRMIHYTFWQLQGADIMIDFDEQHNRLLLGKKHNHSCLLKGSWDKKKPC